MSQSEVTVYLSTADIKELTDGPFEAFSQMLEELVEDGWSTAFIMAKLRAMTHEPKPATVNVVEVEDEVIRCAYCPKIIWHSDSWAPGDEALCSECNKEVTGRWKGPSIVPGFNPPPSDENVEYRNEQ